MMTMSLPGPDTESKTEAIAYAEQNRQFSNMLVICEKTEWPICWTDDVYRHDKEFVANHPNTEFVWILRENGSHLYEIDDDCSGSRSYAVNVIDYHSGNSRLNHYEPSDSQRRPKFYHIRHFGVVDISPEQAKKLIQG